MFPRRLYIFINFDVSKILVKWLKKTSKPSIILLKECDYMAEKRIQKVFYYSSKVAKSIIEGLLEDEAEVTNRS